MDGWMYYMLLYGGYIKWSGRLKVYLCIYIYGCTICCLTGATLTEVEDFNYMYVCNVCMCAGSVVVNDTIFQYVNSFLPFGGVGHSGMGAYKGEFEGFLMHVFYFSCVCMYVCMNWIYITWSQGRSLKKKSRIEFMIQCRNILRSHLFFSTSFKFTYVCMLCMYCMYVCMNPFIYRPHATTLALAVSMYVCMYVCMYATSSEYLCLYLVTWPRPRL